MKIGFFSEAGYQGGVPRNHPNMRTDVAWVCALGAEHVPLPLVREVKKDTFDVGIVIIPKNKMKLAVSKIRGVTSYGMLCSEAELKLSNESDGIIELGHNKYSKKIGDSVVRWKR